MEGNPLSGIPNFDTYKATKVASESAGINFKQNRIASVPQSVSVKVCLLVDLGTLPLQSIGQSGRDRCSE